MRWNRLAAALLVVMNAAACFAETPDWSGNRPQPMQLFQGRLLGGQNWWTRFGEPVNSVALAQAEVSPSDKMAPAGPIPMYGDGGYVYGPGSCDYSPPCTSNLWGGYFSNPWRCQNHHGLHKHCGCGACGDPCGACGGGACGGGRHCHLFQKQGSSGCGCGPTCTTGASCDCAAPSCGAPSCGAPSCSTTADCGCSKPICGKCRPCHHGWRGAMAHWNGGCASCSSPLSCGCTTPAAPTPVMPEFPGSEKQASKGWPTPMPEEANLSPLRRIR